MQINDYELNPPICMIITHNIRVELSFQQSKPNFQKLLSNVLTPTFTRRILCDFSNYKLLINYQYSRRKVALNSHTRLTC